jgi:hypothetical protein
MFLLLSFPTRSVCEGVSKSFWTESITTYTLTTINTRWEATQRVMAAKLTRLTHKIAIQLHLVAESCSICSSRSSRPVQKLLDTPSYILVWESFTPLQTTRQNYSSFYILMVFVITSNPSVSHSTARHLVTIISLCGTTVCVLFASLFPRKLRAIGTDGGVICMWCSEWRDVSAYCRSVTCWTGRRSAVVGVLSSVDSGTRCGSDFTHRYVCRSVSQPSPRGGILEYNVHYLTAYQNKVTCMYVCSLYSKVSLGWLIQGG